MTFNNFGQIFNFNSVQDISTTFFKISFALYIIKENIMVIF